MATIERRVRKSGPPSWRVTVRMREPISRRIVQQRKTFRRKTDAQCWADEQERLIRTGAMSPATEWTVGQFIDGWLADALPLLKGERHRRDRELQAEWWRERLGEARVGEVSPALVSRILDTLDCSVARRNRIKSALGAVFRYWVRRGDLRKADDPTAGLHRREPRGRMRWLDEEERRRLLEAVADDAELDLIVRIALTTGMRQGEIMALTWRACDFDRDVFRIEDTKNGRPRAAPMLPTARSRLLARRQVRRIDTDLVFAGPTGRPRFPRKAWNEAVEAAKLDDFRFHDLRHTAASHLAMSGASLAELAEILGHRTLAMVKRYAHFSQEAIIESARQKMASIDW